MELAHHGGAELIVHMALQQPGHALPDGPQVQAGDPCGLSVPLRGIFDVHGGVVHQPQGPQPGQELGVAGLAVQLDGEAQGLDLLQKSLQPGAEQGLSAGDADPVQQPLPLGEESQQLPAVHGGGEGAGHQVPVVAEGAAEVTAPQENRAGHPARPVQQRQFLQSLNVHGQRSF